MSNMAQQRKIVVASGLLIFRRFQNQIQYLLLQASNGKHHWTPPKGHVDPGETEIEAALRETEEEAGLKKDHLVVIDQFKKVLEYEAWGKPKKVVYWLSELKDPSTPVVISHEHQDFKWLELESAVEFAFYRDQQQLIQEAHHFLLKGS